MHKLHGAERHDFYVLGEFSDIQKEAVIVYFKVLRYDFKSQGNTHNSQLGQLVDIKD
jgi:hypothetical protein